MASSKLKPTIIQQDKENIIIQREYCTDVIINKNTTKFF